MTVENTILDSEYLPEVTRKSDRPVPPARKFVKDLEAAGAFDDLFAKIDAGEVDLAGDGGFINELIKAALEKGLQAELSSHLGYAPGDRAGKTAAETTNARNGSFPKTVATSVGEVDLSVPRDRDGTFTPRLVPKGSRRLGGLDDMIISLYAGGMTIREIQHHLVSTIGADLSHETIANITDAVLKEVVTWQQRPLDEFYPVMYLDAIRVKVRDGGHVKQKSAHIAVGVDMEGIKHVLGIWVQDNEGASFWAHVCAEIANRGVKDVLIVCCDGLVGLPEAIEATWTHAMVQTSSVHHGVSGRVPLIVCTVAGRTYANAHRLRSIRRPVRRRRGRPDQIGQREQHVRVPR